MSDATDPVTFDHVTDSEAEQIARASGRIVRAIQDAGIGQDPHLIMLALGAVVGSIGNACNDPSGFVLDVFGIAKNVLDGASFRTKH